MFSVSASKCLARPAGFYTPCFELYCSGPVGASGEGMLDSPQGSAYVAFIGGRIQHVNTCGNGATQQTYIPFQYGVPQLVL